VARMNEFIRLELKKIGSRNIFAIGVLFVVVILIVCVVWGRTDVLDDAGNPHSGLGAWRILKERTVEGIMTEDYLFAMREHYRTGVDRPFIEGTTDTARKLGLRLMYPHDQLHLTLNYTYNTEYSTMHNDFNLTDEQIAGFYENRKDGLIAFLSEETNGLSYTKSQIERIAEKAAGVDTPFVYRYSMGWQYLTLFLQYTLWMFFIFLSFLLADMFAKNRPKGIDGIALSTRESRRGLPVYKIGAACLSATVAYVIYIGVLSVFVLAVFSFHGWDASGQIGTRSFYSFNMFEDTLIHVLLGWFATIVVTHFILFLSMLFKNGKIVLAISILYFYTVETYKAGISETIRNVMTCMPQNFVISPIDVENLYFIGEFMLPYAAVALCLGALYIVFFGIAIRLMMKRCYLQ
jgi:ABC-type transport system involved in multi-copper enzyme maturation permease subunit